MAKRRAIDSKIRSSQTFAGLTYRQRDLWLGLIVVVDDQGRMSGDARFIRSQVWPYDDIAVKDVEADLQKLIDIGNIIIYEVNGCKYLQIANWHYYQRDAEWLGVSDYPAPPGWIDHARYHGPGKKIIPLNWETRLQPQSTLKVGSTQGSEQGSGLPSRDVNVDGDVNGEDEDEVEDAPKSTPEFNPPAASAALFSPDNAITAEAIYRELTGQFTFPNSDQRPAAERVILTCFRECGLDPGKTKQVLQPFWDAFRASKTQDGRTPAVTHLYWLTEWAAAKEIPAQVARQTAKIAKKQAEAASLEERKRLARQALGDQPT